MKNRKFRLIVSLIAMAILIVLIILLEFIEKPNESNLNNNQVLTERINKDTQSNNSFYNLLIPNINE